MTLVAITPYSRLEKDTILIGVNCIDKMNNQEVREQRPQIINPYEKHSELVKATEYCWSLSLDCCYNLGKTLNNIHGVSYGPSYWKVLLLPWMSVLVENLYDRYLRLRWVRENCLNAVLEIPNVEGLSPLYRKSSDVWSDAHLHSTNIKIYSFLIEAMGLSSNIKYLNVDWNDVRGTSTRVKQTNALVYSKKIAKWLRENANIHKGDAVFWEFFNKTGTDVFYLSRKIGCLQLGVPVLQDKDFSQLVLDRRKIAFKCTNDEFKKILQYFIPWALPISLFEEYRERRYIALRFLRKIKIMFISNRFWENDTLKILIAELKEKDGKIIGRQHGAGYGNYVIATPERVEREISDYFITWGWKDERQCPTVQLPDPRLSDLANTHSKNNRNILFIGSHAPMYMFRYQSYWIPEFVYLKYYPLKQKFFQKLEESVRNYILYRPYPFEYGWNEEERIREILPNVRFDKSSPIQSMKNCSLVVIDHPGTSLLEALAINVPTISFWDNDQCPMREEAKPYFQLLKDAGILYYDPIDAAKRVNEVAKEPEIWWANGMLQSARQEFCHRFAWADSNWKRIWVKTLKSLC